MSEPGEPRQRVLISAYQCGPGEGSEQGAGWAFVRAAAMHAEVWLITRKRFEEPIRAALILEPDVARHLHVEYLDLSDRVLRAKRAHRDVYWYYVLWQRAVARLARHLQEQVRFDVAHHVTFASDWQPCGLTALDTVPLVWGPVGGATYQPVALARWLGARGALAELLRSIGTRFARRLWGDRTARRAALVVAMNAQVAHRFRTARQVVIEPNIALEDQLPVRTSAQVRAARPRRRAVFIGRLLPWKGARLAINALARVGPDWELHLYGDGPDREHLDALVARLGLGERVSFLGHRPRPEALAALADADAFIFPSMHDSAGWVAGEASALGCPVICLDHGGPPLLADVNARVVPVRGDVVGMLARELAACASRDGVATRRWSAERLPALTASWYRSVTAARATPRRSAG